MEHTCNQLRRVRAVAVSRECVAERLRAILPGEAAYEKDALLPVLISTVPQALLTNPQLAKLISLGLMEYRETAIVSIPTSRKLQINVKLLNRCSTGITSQG